MSVDCRITAHIITDKSKFVHTDRSFNESKHIIELKDRSCTAGLVHARGNTNIFLGEDKGNIHEALDIPSY